LFLTSHRADTGRCVRPGVAANCSSQATGQIQGAVHGAGVAASCSSQATGQIQGAVYGAGVVASCSSQATGQIQGAVHCLVLLTSDVPSILLGLGLVSVLRLAYLPKCGRFHEPESKQCNEMGPWARRVPYSSYYRCLCTEGI
jgi:hypothetical protein